MRFFLISAVATCVDAFSTQPAHSHPPKPKTVVDVAVENGGFNTLTAALAAAGLVDTLKGDGPFTVLAPTDAAFAALPPGTVDALLNDIPALTKILTYHVLSGRVDSSAVIGLDGQSATTVEGSSINIEVVNGNVGLNGDAAVTTVDVPASNGLIHVIDKVLMPPSPKPKT